MATIRGTPSGTLAGRAKTLASELATAIKSDRPGGQPRIEELRLRGDNLRVAVLWDKWVRMTGGDRFLVTRRAYELAKGGGPAERIALAVTLTMPEAHDAGLIPFSVIPAVREGDPVTPDQCVAALLADGASKLFPGRKAEHRFTTRAEVDAAVERLSAALQGSGPVWVVVEDLPRSAD